MKVVGLDLSLTSTGIALVDGTMALDAAPRRGLDRIIWLRDRILDYVMVETYGSSDRMPREHLVVIEDYAFSRAAAHAHELGELGGVVKVALIAADIGFVTVLPNQLKMYALGKGGGKGTDKAAVRIAAWKRAEREFLTDDECDAWWLRQMGLDAYGQSDLEMPASHRKVLSDIAWPTIVGDVDAPAAAL